MEATWWQIVVILISGLLAGFINAMAGGGSFLTLAALQLTGMPINLANATNRLAVFVQNIAAVYGFRSKGVSDLKLSVQLAVPTLIGSLIGAYAADWMPKKAFEQFLAAMMVVMLLTLILQPEKRWLKNAHVELTPARRIIGYIVFLAIGFYGGIIQAGVGFFLIAGLVLFGGFDLVRTNSHKVFIIGAFTLVALLVFIFKGQVNWLLGLVLSVGNALGAWFSSRLQVAKGDRIVRIVLAVMLVVLSLRYFGVLKF